MYPGSKPTLPARLPSKDGLSIDVYGDYVCRGVVPLGKPLLPVKWTLLFRRRGSFLLKSESGFVAVCED